MFATAKSELGRHSQPGGTRDDEDSAWINAGDNESLDSFITNCPPSFLDKSWIVASHDGMAELIEEYYTSTMGAEGARGRDNMEEIRTAWEESEDKSVDTLTNLLKEYKFGSGKWMIFVTTSEVDAVWRKVVSALWDGKLGQSARVTGNTPGCNGSHVINVFVDPFWEVKEVERVLASLRELCGVNDAIKFKADGVSQLGLGKQNEYGIPPSFYAANRGASTVVVQKPGGGGKAPKGEWERGAKPDGAAAEGGGASSARGGGKKDDDKWAQRSSTWVAREAPQSRKRTEVKAPEKKVATKTSAFAALTGLDDDDAAAIIAKKERKKERARKKAAEKEEQAVVNSEAAFAALKSGIGGAWMDDEEEEDEGSSSEEDAEKPASPGASSLPDVSDAPAPVKEKTAEELEVEALMASLDAKDDAKEDDPNKVSKSAAKRAKKKAAAAAGGEAAAEPTEDAENVDNAAEEGGAPKSAEEIKKMMAAKAAAAKKKGGSSGQGGSAAAVALAEAKARAAMDNGKKKKGAKTWEGGGKNARGQKARGSDNKYQGE